MKTAWAILVAIILQAGVCLADIWIVDGVRLGAATGGAAAEGTYPVVILPLGGQWTDFELKATTNNFQTLSYYVQSSATNRCADDTNVWVYFTDDHAVDVRKWVKSAVATSIGSQLVNPTNSVVEYAVVCPSHDCAVDWRGWMSATNTHLVWSFVRFDGIDLEKNVDGTKSRWSPVVPAVWRTERVAP